MIPTHKDLILASERIKPYIHRTPVLESSTINNMLNGHICFKCENFQRMGAFKMRGATNAILQLNKGQRARGVITHSSGNFAQALALAAKSLNTKAYIIMPHNASSVKIDAVKGYGAEIIECAPTLESRIKVTQEYQERTGATFIHSSNDVNVIIGNASAAIELIEDMKEIDVIIAPVGGGGLIAGTALAVNYMIHYT
ncbi:MAG TPA: pyridoxal-phosphate dependent enzyme, partial [Bacteroidaceae bacterium]|nr:pyridoxal-phosphate dependent enzyme [Bacteroidaceae bacterium]